ncbi:hypothetical protein J437_LFUL011131 [Ladona fulva]|uniref:Uncharacterized protein n=1 Tax=Ladona fulva TaxID=123851 RepID=A0A8K0K6J5_LADFU|nr:hypothetical protein J437_LFUL011131 [Ladona fulva]
MSDKLSEELEKEGQNINVADYAGWTALHEAVTAGHLDCVRKLLEYQPKKVVYQTRHKKEKISESQEPKELKTLVNLHAKGGDMGVTALHEAIIQNRILIVDLLLKYGGSSLLNDTTKDGYTAFDLTADEAMLDLLHCHKRESRLVEKKFISDMKFSFLSIPKSKSCITLHCMLLQAYIESNCLMAIMQNVISYKRKKSQKISKSNALQSVDYLESSHDMKSLLSFIKCAKSHMKNKSITFPESCLILFLC